MLIQRLAKTIFWVKLNVRSSMKELMALVDAQKKRHYKTRISRHYKKNLFCCINKNAGIIYIKKTLLSQNKNAGITLAPR